MTRVAVWSPLPPARSGIADYVAEALPALNERLEVEAVVPDPSTVAPEIRSAVEVVAPGESRADLDLYHVGNSPEHAYVYRRALRVPGVVLLHEWNLHHLVLLETVERGAPTAYLREMRREHGAVGSLVGRLVARALGGEMLPALYPLNARLLEASLALVALTDGIAEQARRCVPDRPVLRLPHHLALPLDPLPSRAEARASLGLSPEDEIVTAPGLGTRAKRLDALIAACAGLSARRPRLRLVIAGPVAPDLDLGARDAGLGERLVCTGRLTMPDFIRHLVAADLVVALRFPSYGEISGALVRALGVGRAACVTAGTPAAEEFPEGLVVPITPGVYEEALLEALLDRLLGDDALRRRIGGLAQAHVREHHDLQRTTGVLAGFLEGVGRERTRLEGVVRRSQAPADGLLEFLQDEIRWYARGIDVPMTAVAPRLRDLVGGSC